MRGVLAEEGERAAYTQKALAQEAARAAFDEKISRLHHLLSTSSQPGIFASPYALAAGTVPVIAGAPVEEHLKAAFRKAGAPARQQQQQQGNQTSPARLGAFLPPIVKSATSSPTTTTARGPGQLHHQQQQQQQQQASPQDRQSGVVSSTGRGVYPTEVLMTGLDRMVPRNLTLRQTVPYDVVHQAQVLETKVVKAEVRTVSFCATVLDCARTKGSAHKEKESPQPRWRQRLHWRLGLGPGQLLTRPLPGARCVPAAAQMMMRHPVPFASSLRKPEQPALAVQTNQNLEGYHDPYDPTIGARTETFTPRQASMSPTRFAKYPAKQPYFDAELLPPADALPPKTYRPAPAPPHAAGLSSAEVRRRATKPAR